MYRSALLADLYIVKGVCYGELDDERDIHKTTTWSIVLSVLMIAAGVLAISGITRLMLSVAARRIVA